MHWDETLGEERLVNLSGSLNEAPGRHQQFVVAPHAAGQAFLLGLETDGGRDHCCGRHIISAWQDGPIACTCASGVFS
jgi:hypothetical protein